MPKFVYILFLVLIFSIGFIAGNYNKLKQTEFLDKNNVNECLKISNNAVECSKTLFNCNISMNQVMAEMSYLNSITDECIKKHDTLNNPKNRKTPLDL